MTAELSKDPILKNEMKLCVGSIVECKTCFDEIFTGEVMAFEYDNKILVLKIPSSSSSSSSTCNIVCINLEFCSNVECIPSSEPTTVNNSNNNNNNNSNKNIILPDMNTNKIEERLRSAVKDRKNLIEAHKSGVSSDGISLYLSLLKKFGGSVTLESLNDNKGYCIVINKNARIVPPFSADCVQAVNKTSGGSMSNDALNYAKQLVEKFWNDQNKDPYTLKNFGQTSSVSSSVSSTTLSSPSMTSVSPQSNNNINNTNNNNNIDTNHKKINDDKINNDKNQNNITNNTNTKSKNTNTNNNDKNPNLSSKESPTKKSLSSTTTTTTAATSASATTSSTAAAAVQTAISSTFNNLISTTKSLMNLGNVQPQQQQQQDSSATTNTATTLSTTTTAAAAAVNSKKSMTNSRH